jgi:hypothetical protein
MTTIVLAIMSASPIQTRPSTNANQNTHEWLAMSLAIHNKFHELASASNDYSHHGWLAMSLVIHNRFTELAIARKQIHSFLWAKGQELEICQHVISCVPCPQHWLLSLRHWLPLFHSFLCVKG